MNTIGVLVVGIGGGIGSHKARIFRSMEGVHLYGVENNDARRREAEREFGVPVFSSLEEALEKADFQAVTVDVPNAYHADITVRALQAGKAVLCEKPMATTEKDCLRMLEAAKNMRGFLQIGFELRYSLLYARAKEIVQSGEIGELASITCFYAPGSGAWEDSESMRWKKDPAITGGIFFEKLCHYLDFPRWLSGGEIEEIIVFASPNVVPGYRIHDNLHTLYRLEGGSVGELTFTMGRAAIPEEPADARAHLAAGHELAHTIVGTRGCMYFSVWTSAITVVRAFHQNGKYRPQVNRVERLDDKDPEIVYHNVRDEVIDFMRRVREGLPPFTPPEDSFKTMRVCFAAEKSLRTGEKISID